MPGVASLTDFSSSFVGLAGSVFGLAEQANTDRALTALYDEADRLAVMTVKSVTALLWWAAHIGSAAADAEGYGAQIRKALTDAGLYGLDTWREFLNVKYPDDLQSLYDTLHSEISDTGKKLTAAQAKGLGKLAAEIAALIHWRKVTVTPDLVKWTRFYAAWQKTYLPPLGTLMGWLASPSKFTTWAIMPLMNAALAELSDAGNVKLSTAIEQALTATWRNNPQGTYDSVLAWLVAG